MKKKYMLITSGSLFILATISTIVSSSLLETTFTTVLQQKNFELSPAIFGIILALVNIFSVITISILFQMMLKSYHSKLSIIYLISRIFEGFFLFLSVASIFPLLCSKITTTNLSELMHAYNNWFQLGMFALGLGSIFLLILLKREKKMGNFLYILGIISYLALFASSILELANLSSAFTMMFYLPGTIFEVIFPIWLIKKGIGFDRVKKHREIGYER